LIPDGRCRPICSQCGTPTSAVHSHARRWVRDLRLGARETVLDLRQRKVRCLACGGVRIEALEFVDRHQRVTKRLARYMAGLCRLLSVKAVAEHLGLDWKLVKACDKAVLTAEVGGTDYLPRARIVYDLFHVIANYSQHVLDAVRISAYGKVRDREERKVIKGSRFLLYQNEGNLTDSERPRLRALLELNEDIATAHIHDSEYFALNVKQAFPGSPACN
jgi:transposase